MPSAIDTKRRAHAAAAAVVLLALVLAVSAPVRAQAQDEAASPGDAVEYRVSQKVGVISDEIWQRYGSLELLCEVPEAVRIDSARLLKGAQDLTASAGTLSVDHEANTATFSFSAGYLASTMALSGESYDLVVSGTVMEAPEGGAIECRGSSSVSGIAQQSNVVTSTVRAAALDVSLETLGGEVLPGADGVGAVGFVATVAQPVEGAHARGVELSFEVPSGLSLVPGTIVVEGIEGADISHDGGGFTVRADRMEHGEATVSFTCETTPEAAGLDVGCEVSASAFGIEPVASEAGVSVVDVLSPRSATVSVEIDSSTLRQGHGSPVFGIVLEGEDLAGNKVTKARPISFAGTIEASGPTTLEARFDSLPAGTYEARVVMPSRYRVSAAIGPSGEEAGTTVDLDLVRDMDLGASFRCEKTSYQYLSSTDFAVIGAGTEGGE